MSRLTLHQADAVPDPTLDTPSVESGRRQAIPAAPLTPLLVNIEELAVLLSRGVPSLHRDDAAGRLPAALRIGGAKRWRYAEIVAWVEAGCPPRSQWTARRSYHH
jgi:predicted DNA-binding transcriptional regulator AlpA